MLPLKIKAWINTDALIKYTKLIRNNKILIGVNVYLKTNYPKKIQYVANLHFI